VNVTGLQAIRLVARREIVTRSRDRSTFVSTGITVLILAAVIFLPSLFGGTSTATVAVAGPDAARIAQTAVRLEKSFGVKVEVKRVADDAAVRRLVDTDEADAGLLAGGKRIVAAGGAPDGTVPALQEASRGLRADAPDPPPLPVRSLDQDAEERQAFAVIALIVLYGQLIGYGIWVANGVVEEKASRIVEILLATIRPRELLFGKVLGVGVVGLAQLLLIAAIGLGLGAASGRVDIGATELATLPIVLGWFVLGYALYAGAFALAGALVSRQEDVQSVVTPMIMAILASLFLSFRAVDDPSGTFATVLGFVPISAPLVMPTRMIAGGAGALEVLVSVAIVLASTYAVIAFAGRLYGAAVLQTGGRVKLRSLMRA